MSSILHPRPSPLAAAMYTLRDLDADVIVMHSPSGCCFRPARLLEKDGVKVVTTGLTDDDFVFGGEEKLIHALKRVDELFKPKLIGVVGSCASMIIGEDLGKAVKKAGVEGKTISCDIHSGSGDNTVGAVMVLKEAWEKGIITKGEYERQRDMLKMATDVEKQRGTARGEYLGTLSGDSPRRVAKELVQALRDGKEIACVLNAKKETVFLYADLMVALGEATKMLGGKVRNLANLDSNVGLPRVRGYALAVLREMEQHGIKLDGITGGLDEYPLAGRRASELLAADPPDLAVVSGIPHAVHIEKMAKTIAVTVGTRAVFNIKELGYHAVVAERDAHEVSLGVKKRIRRSLLGQALRAELG